MVYRVFVEKKKELAHEARSLREDIRSLLHIQSLTELRVVNRYDVENISPASSTSGQTPPPSVSRSSPRASARRSAPPEYIFSEARLRKKSLRR